MELSEEPYEMFQNVHVGMKEGNIYLSVICRWLKWPQGLTPYIVEMWKCYAMVAHGVTSEKSHSRKWKAETHGGKTLLSCLCIKHKMEAFQLLEEQVGLTRFGVVHNVCPINRPASVTYL